MINTKRIVLDPHPALRTKCEKVLFPLAKEDETLLKEMITYVKHSTIPEIAEKDDLQPAVGIAAPQVGVLKQMCVVVVSDYDPKTDEIVDYEYALINPVIVSQSDKLCALKDGEGCLSIKDQHPGLVYRPYRIKVKAYDYITKQNITINASGYLAIVLQHEIDHLNGILFYDRIQSDDPWLEKPNSLLL